MRILVVNPNTTRSMTLAIGESARRYARNSTEIVAIEPDWGPEAIEGFMEGFLSAAAVIERLATYDGQYDAVVMAGYGEPGREGLRELLTVPIFDITESSAHIACLLGHRYGVATTLDRAIPQIEESLRNAGLIERCAGIRATGLGVLEIDADAGKTRAALLEQAQRLITEDGAEVICLGCGGMASLDKDLETELGVPVIDGVVAAVKLAEACHDYGVRTSKVRSFAPPRKKEILGWPRARPNPP
jgi:allantoin racemase